VPLAPYMLTKELNTALMYSVAVTLVALFIFGYVKGRPDGNIAVARADCRRW